MSAIFRSRTNLTVVVTLAVAAAVTAGRTEADGPDFYYDSDDSITVESSLTDETQEPSAAESEPQKASISDTCGVCTPQCACECECGGWCDCVDWSTIPFSITKMPRPGNFTNPPNSPGYFTTADWLLGNCKNKRPPSGYPPIALMPPGFFDADFRYVDKKPYEERSIVESLKRIQLTDCVMFSTGGNAWVRYMKEQNSRLTEVENSYTLPRVRAYGDVNVGDVVRVFGEYLWADNINSELPPLPIDENLGDILNLFVDVNLTPWSDRALVARIGRQELLFGSQRLVSTLDWANVRRTFEGVRLFQRGEKWDVDAFWAEFVPALAKDFDEADENQKFAGAWLTYRREKGEFLDFYYLFLNNSNDIVRRGIEQAPFEAHTLGSRWSGDECGWLWDLEGAVQFGDQAGSDLGAGAGTAGLGRHMKECWGNPTLWAYYDFASGDADPDSGKARTFNDLYPFGHYYLGWADLVGRRNIHDANAHLFLYPTQWTTVWLQYHHFWLAQGRDALYNAGGVPIRRDATGQSGQNVGDEIDIVLNFHLTNYSDFMFGYSRLFGGGFLENTSGPNAATDSDLMFFMYQLKW